MLTPGKTLAALLALMAAGCAGDPHRARTRVPDWENEDVASAAVASRPGPKAAPTPPATPLRQPALIAPNQIAETWVPWDRWCKDNGLKEPLRLVPQDATGLAAFSLTTSSGIFVVSAASRTAHWDGLEFRLGFAPQLIDGQLYLHTVDLKKTMAPLLGDARASFFKTNPVIVIDAGHGGESVGTKSVLANRYEKEFTLDWALRLEALLATNGWLVFMTRTNDTYLSLSNRVAFAEEHKAGLFLSLHFNSSAPKEDQEGLETYCLTPTGMPSTVTRGFADDLGLSFPNNNFDAQNLQVAFRVHRALLKANGFHDRGVRRARFLGVLRWQQRPAILVEGGYLSSPREARLISNPAYRQKLAEAVARALCDEPGTGEGKSEGRGQRAEVGGRRSEAGSTARLP